MSGKMLEVYENYDVDIEQTFRVRGATLLRTNKGIVQFKQVEMNEKRIVAEYNLKEALYENGFLNTDRCVPNKDGELISYDRYGSAYVMRKAFEGRECNICDLEDIKIAAINLGKLHLVGKHIFDMSEADVHIRINGDFYKRNTELRRIRAFMGKRNPKREFEEIYIQNFDYFYNQAKSCEKRYGEIKSDNDKKHIGYCHGMYNHHSVIMVDGENDSCVATINFDRFYVGNQLADLYHLIRKVVEKNGYDYVFFKTIIEKYSEIIALDKQDIEYIYICLCYPEKFYKISNQYYNSSKNWVSPKLKLKLNDVVAAEKNKVIFLGEMLKFIEGI